MSCRKLVAVELFCGTKSFSKAVLRRGGEVFTVDLDPQHDPDLVADVMTLSIEDLPERFRHPDVVWSSVPCTCFSVANFSRHNFIKRGWHFFPNTPAGHEALSLLRRTLDLIRELAPIYYFIENPRGLMRHMTLLNGYKRRTVTYCQYGDIAQKPTDIWTNCYVWRPRRMCRAGDPCHENGSRGMNYGTTSKRSSVERAIVPAALCDEIVAAVEEQHAT